MLCSPRSYSKIKRSFSSITLLVFQGMHRLYTGATLLLQCQESSRSILSAIPPVCTAVKLPPLPDASGYSMRVLSAYIPGGMTSRVHFHSGVEAFYTVDGEQCLETGERAYPLHKGDSLALPAGVVMRLVATGSTPRRAFGLIVYDSTRTPTTRLPMEMSSQLVSCKK